MVLALKGFDAIPLLEVHQVESDLKAVGFQLAAAVGN
jgi:hypothetical protein